MSKKLSEMSLEELWQLFPIFLTEHQGCWKAWYVEEESFLRPLLPQAVQINHVGSTAIQSIWAKPIIDILVEVPIECDLSGVKDVLEENGYICMTECENRISFNKGYTENGFAERVFHVHVRFRGDNDELYFRDYLNEFPEVGKQYEQMKRKLWKEYEHDRDGYTNAKTDFVKKHTNVAKEKYKNRY